MKLYLDATSITVGVENTTPTVCMCFPSGRAKEVMESLLIPYAKPHDFKVGVGLLDYSDDLEVATYCAIRTPHILDLGVDGIVAGPTANPGYTYVLGTIADLKPQFVTFFLERIKELGYFQVRCGFVQPDWQTAAYTEWQVRLGEVQDSLAVRAWLLQQLNP